MSFADYVQALRPPAQRRACSCATSRSSTRRSTRPCPSCAKTDEVLGRASASSAPCSSTPTPACSRSGRACSTPRSGSRQQPRARGRATRCWVRELLGRPQGCSPPGCAPRCTCWCAPSPTRTGRTRRAPCARIPTTPKAPGPTERFEAALAPFFAEYGELVFTPEARRHQWTQISRTGERTWEVAQTLLDPAGRQPLGGARDDRPERPAGDRRTAGAGGADRGLRTGRPSRGHCEVTAGLRLSPYTLLYIFFFVAEEKP